MEGVLVALAVLACPVGMGAMMWFMAKGMRGQKKDERPASIEELRSEQERIAAQLDRLENQKTVENGQLARR
jgi:flagellar basal body-associated protein FliL